MQERHQIPAASHPPQTKHRTSMRGNMKRSDGVFVIIQYLPPRVPSKMIIISTGYNTTNSNKRSFCIFLQAYMWTIMENFVRPRSCYVGQILKVNVYIGIKIKICVNCVITCTNIFLVSRCFRKYILLPTSNVSVLSYLQKMSKVRVWSLYGSKAWNSSVFLIENGLKLFAQNKLPKQNICDIICPTNITTRQSTLNSINVNGTKWY